MLRAQRFVPRVPPRALTLATRAMATRAFTHWAFDHYLEDRATRISRSIPVPRSPQRQPALAA